MLFAIKPGIGYTENCAVKLMLVGCGLTKSLARVSSKSTPSPWRKATNPPPFRFVQLTVVRSQLVPLTPFQATLSGTAVTLMSMESLPVLFCSVATTPSGRFRLKFAILPSGAPLYLIKVKVPAFSPSALKPMTMLVPGAEMPPAALMAGAVGLAERVP